MRNVVAIHLPRVMLVVCAAAGMLFWLVSLATAGSFTPECAERDLTVLTVIEEHANAADVPDTVLTAAGFAQLDARLACLADRQVEALTKYDAILNAPQFSTPRNDMATARPR